MDENHVCAAIWYSSRVKGFVQFDLCYDKTELDSNNRELLHKALDEWLDKANGNGCFIVGYPWK